MGRVGLVSSGLVNHVANAVAQWRCYVIPTNTGAALLKQGGYREAGGGMNKTKTRDNSCH